MRFGSQLPTPTFAHGFSKVGFATAHEAAGDAWHQPHLRYGEDEGVESEWCEVPPGLAPCFVDDAQLLVRCVTLAVADAFLSALHTHLSHAVATAEVPSAMRIAVRNFDEDHTMWSHCVAGAFQAIDFACELSPSHPADTDHPDAPDMDYLTSLLSPEDAHLADAPVDSTMHDTDYAGDAQDAGAVDDAGCA